MSPEDCRPLDEYIRDLVAVLADDHPRYLDRMRTVVGRRAARIAVDDEVVTVQFVDGDLDTNAVGPVDGQGATDTAAVLDILDGYLEVADALILGRLRVRGSPDSVHRMFVAIEILLDVAARSPRLQGIAAAFRADPCHAPADGRRSWTVLAPEYPAVPTAAELALLESLRLLPER